MLRDAEFFRTKIGALDGAADTGDFIVNLVKEKNVPRPVTTTPPPVATATPPPDAATPTPAPAEETNGEAGEETPATE